MFRRPLMYNDLSVVPMSFSDVVVGAVVNDACLIHHTFLPLFLVIQEHGVGWGTKSNGIFEQ